MERQPLAQIDSSKSSAMLESFATHGREPFTPSAAGLQSRLRVASSSEI